MDIAEFAEKIYDVKLYEWQKDCLRKFEELRQLGRVRIVPGRKGRCYIYLDETMLEELTRNGKTSTYNN